MRISYFSRFVYWQLSRLHLCIAAVVATVEKEASSLCFLLSLLLPAQLCFLRFSLSFGLPQAALVCPPACLPASQPPSRRDEGREPASASFPAALDQHQHQPTANPPISSRTETRKGCWPTSGPPPAGSGRGRRPHTHTHRQGGETGDTHRWGRRQTSSHVSTTGLTNNKICKGDSTLLLARAQSITWECQWLSSKCCPNFPNPLVNVVRPLGLDVASALITPINVNHCPLKSKIA